MADIKQAAKWMEDGEKVFRTEFSYRVIGLSDYAPAIQSYNTCEKYFTRGLTVSLDIDDLTAEDWEIYHG